LPKILLTLAANRPTYNDLLRTVELLLKRVADLEEEVRQLRVVKNSNNSSLPPGKDENRPKKNQSLREQSGKTSGGQKGHRGSTLQMVSDPDETIIHIPCNCVQCGYDLTEVPQIFHSRRQVVDLPPIKPIYTEHRSYTKQCRCGHVNYQTFPLGVDNHIQYGSNIESLVAYLNVGQYLPYNRIQSLFESLFNVPLSQGSISNMLERFARKATPMYQQIRKELESSKTVGGDETGVKVNDDNWWFWVWQNRFNTYITASDNRGFRTIEEHFPNGFINAHLVSDCYSAHLKTHAHSHQLCTSHLLRDLNYLIELTKSSKATRLKMLLLDALNLKRLKDESTYHLPCSERTFIRKELVRLLGSFMESEHKKVKTFFKRIVKYQQYILEFLYHYDVPPDNNGSERAIRNAKVKQKVSTQFRSQTGISNYAIIRSVFDTAIKRGISIFEISQLTVALKSVE
jgi:transposase